jgi:hypothetical protein
VHTPLKGGVDTVTGLKAAAVGFLEGSVAPELIVVKGEKAVFHVAIARAENGVSCCGERLLN